MNEGDLSGSFNQDLRRLLDGKNPKDFPNTIKLLNYLREISISISKKYPSPKSDSEKFFSLKDTSDRIEKWKTQLNKSEKTLMKFSVVWWAEVITTLIKISQAANLLLKPIPKKALLNRSIHDVTEWYDLMISLYLTQADMFRERIKQCYGILEKTARGDDPTTKRLRAILTENRRMFESGIYTDMVVQRREKEVM